MNKDNECRMKKYYDEEKNSLIYEGINENAYTFMDKATKDYGEYTAITYFGNKISYTEFKEWVNIYANNLSEYGLKAGDSITLLLPNTPEIVYYFYACWILGVTVSPIDPRTSPVNVLRIIKNTDAKLLVVILDKYAEKVLPILDKISVEKIVVVSPTDSMGNSLKEEIGRGLYKTKEFYLNLTDKNFSGSKIIMNKKFIKSRKLGNITPVFYETELGFPAVNLFTSGTEGSPKTALHSHQAYNVKANQIQFALPKAVPGDKFLGIIPFFSGYGSF